MVTCPAICCSRFFIAAIFSSTLLTALAAASSTETQFSDGTTSYTHTFSGAGTGSTAGVVMPVGAEVTAATFNLLGEAATTTWANASTNTNFGGPATTNGLMSVPWFTQGYRYDIDVGNDQAFLRPQETTQEWKLTSSSDISSNTNGYHNTTGAFFANGDQGAVLTAVGLLLVDQLRAKGLAIQPLCCR